MVMVREWCHIKMTKRAGRGHDTSGIVGTSQGELAIRCRACPQPGVNLPMGWENGRADERFAWSFDDHLSPANVLLVGYIL
jgi:hypothetical protein